MKSRSRPNVPEGTSARVVPDGHRRRTLLVLALATATGSARVAAEIFGTETAAGLPLGLLVAGQAAAGAFLLSGVTGPLWGMARAWRSVTSWA